MTVVIPFFNCRYVDQAITSVLNQTYPNIEIIVVDVGSTMNQELLKPYMNRIQYFGKTNGGAASALNYGMRISTGKYITWLNSDDMFYPVKIERQVSFMEHRQAEISFTDYHIINSTSEITQHNATAKFITARSFIEAFSSYCPVNDCTVMMRKEFIHNIGYFNETLTYTHGYDLWIRTLLNRTDFYYMDEPLTAYRRHGGMGTVQHYPAVLWELETLKQAYRSQLQMLMNIL